MSGYGQQNILCNNSQQELNKYSLDSTVHDVLFVDFVFLPTEQAATYLKICISTYLLTYIGPSSFDWKENTFFLIFVNSKL